MNFRTTLFLLVLVVAVGITIFFVNHHDENTKKPDKTEERKLFDFDSADVLRISLTNSVDDKHFVLQKTGSDWNLVEPVAARAKSFEVDDLVRAITGLKSRSQVDASKKTSGGLDHPSFVVELTTKAGKTAKLSFGDNSALGDSLYVLVDGSDKPDIIGHSIYETLSKPASNYRDMKLVNTPSADIRQLAITDKGKTIKLVKNGEKWKVTEPAEIPAETSAVTEILSSITSLDAAEFVDSPTPAVKSSLSHPHLQVAFSTAAPTTQPASTQPSAGAGLAGAQTIQFGAYKDISKKDVYALLDGKEVAVISATSEKSFEKTPLDLRDRQVLTVATDRVSSFTIGINKPATTQPTTQPAEIREFTIERHKIAAPVLGPALPADSKSPTTKPAEAPTTQPSASTTQPAVATTQPSAPVVAATQPDETATAKWVFTSGGKGVADEGQVNELLSSLDPLRAEKYIEPEKVVGATYTLTIHVIPAKASESNEDVTLTIIDGGTRVVGLYKDLQFEVNRSLIEKLTGDFKTKKAAPPEMPPSMRAGGSPFGGGGGAPFGG